MSIISRVSRLFLDLKKGRKAYSIHIMNRWYELKKGIRSGVPFPVSAGLSLFAYTGAGQMAAIGLLERGATVFAIVFTTFILNLRHFIMSTCVMQKLKEGKRWQRALISFWITDEVFAIYMTDENVRPSYWFLVGLALSSYGAWQVGSWIGVFTTSLLPAQLSASLGISLYAMFIALLVPGAKKSIRLAVVIVITAF